MKFVIDRTKWLRGIPGGGLLLAEDGKQCCIGQICSQLGLADFQIISVGDAANVVFTTQTFIDTLLQDDIGRFSARWVESCYSINDSDNIDDGERERLIKLQAASAGHEFEFIN